MTRRITKVEIKGRLLEKKVDEAEMMNNVDNIDTEKKRNSTMVSGGEITMERR